MPAKHQTAARETTVKIAGLIAVSALALTGCGSMPDQVDANWLHVSHPLLGPPFGPSNEEDTLDVLELRTAWHRDRYFLEVGLGHQLRDNGFYGDDFIFTSRVGVEIWKR